MKPIKPINLLTCLMALGLAFSGVAAQAADAPASVVLESFACNYHDGKDIDDLLAARDYMVKQADKAGVSLAPSYVWSQFKGGPGLDHIWFTVHESLNAFAAESEAFGSAPELAGVNARFGTVASCESNIAMARPIFQGSEAEPPGGPAFISSNACMFRPGADASSLGDLENHINGVLGGISAYNSTTVISATPFTSGPNSADLYIFAINENQSAWAAGVTAFQASAGGPGLGRHFDSVLDCDTALWFSQQVVGGED